MTSPFQYNSFSVVRAMSSMSDGKTFSLSGVRQRVTRRRPIPLQDQFR